MKPLTREAIDEGLAALPGWRVEGGKLHKEYRFKTFTEAFAFMTRVAAFAEAEDHHPEWFNVYGTVRVDLVTHDAGGITERDLRLATAMESCVAR